MSVAAVQQQLLAPGKGEQIELAAYLTRLCDTLAASMVSESRGVLLKVDIEPSTVASNEAISIGLAVTEPVINALKHAFPADGSAGLILVHMKLPKPIGGFRFPTMGLADQRLVSMVPRRVSGRASYKRWRGSLTAAWSFPPRFPVRQCPLLAVHSARRRTNASYRFFRVLQM
jgi:hypothetical protein